MGEKVDLPGGHWAEVRDPMDITVDEVRPLKEKLVELGRARKGASSPVGSVAASGSINPMAGFAAPPVEESPVGEQLDQIEGFEHAAMAFFIVSWDFDFAPSAETLRKLPIPVYNALDAAVAPYLGEVFPQFKKDDSPTTP